MVPFTSSLPHIVSAKPILYDLDTIHTQLSQIIGGIGNGWFSAVNEMRVNKLRKYIPAVYGHWGGYWHFVTMPKIYKVQIYHNGAIVSFRNSWSGGVVFGIIVLAILGFYLLAKAVSDKLKPSARVEGDVIMKEAFNGLRMPA